MKLKVEDKFYLLCGVLNEPHISKNVDNYPEFFEEYVGYVVDNFPEAKMIRPFKNDTNTILILIATEVDNKPSDGVYSKEAIVKLAEEYQEVLPWKDFANLGEVIESYMPKGTTIH